MATNAYTQDPRIEESLLVLEQASTDARQALERFKAEVQFCAGMAHNKPEKREEWLALIQQAVSIVNAAIAGDGKVAEAVRAAEATLDPLATSAKQYTIHCVGHGHIDMDWMWSWPETVATTNDTFSTVDRLMGEFPDFHYSQSQASVYQVMKDYLPELYAKVKQRVAEGRWEVTANQWVEGDKNLASGEILCRHVLYTKRFFKQEFGIPYDAVKIDWEPDTFGHAHTLPTILNKGGIRRYYLHRAGPGPMLFWWQGKDGSRVLAFDDRPRGYNGQINAQIINLLFDFEQATSLKDFLFVYGVGDHGGGPTRRDLQNAMKMAEWPLFPKIKLSTTDAFFSIAERDAKNLPVIDAEMNYVFEGCYTAQSNIKRANRKSENALVGSEVIALLAKGLAALPYPVDDLALAWRHAMFNQFHDILPGSGVHATYEYSQGLFQEILARTSMIKTRSLRKLAGMVDVSALTQRSHPIGANAGYDVGGGPGDITGDGSLSRRGAGGGVSDPFVIFNPNAWRRSELVTARLWDRTYPDKQISITDDAGNMLPAQVIERGNYWGHNFIGVAFVAKEVPGTGWRTYNVAHDVTAQNHQAEHLCSGDGKGTLENEFLKVVVEQGSGAITHLIDKRTGIDLVPSGKRLGVLEYFLEAPHPMTAWVIGQIKQYKPFMEGGVIDCPANGPYLASVRTRHSLNDSKFTLTISLAAGVPRVDFTLEANWLERGAPEIGVPMLRVAFPLALRDGVATFECPNGHVTRTTQPGDLTSYTHWLGGMYWPTSEAVDPTPGDVPAQKWADLSGQTATAQLFGATIMNDTKYGYNVNADTLRLTLLRSSYDPDPLPELGTHLIKFAIQPHDGSWTPADSTRAGYEFNNLFEVVGTDDHKGTLPTNAGYAEVLTSHVMLSGLKKAEDSDALIVRLYETNGQTVKARVRLAEAFCAANAPAVETDLVEQPLQHSSARMQDGVLSVDIPAYGMVTVKIG